MHLRPALFTKAAIGLFFSALLLGAAVSFGQQAQPASPAAAPAPQSLSEVEQLRLRVLTLNATIVSIRRDYNALLTEMQTVNPGYQTPDQQLKQFSQQYGSAVQQIERDHPGQTLNPQSGTLVPKPAPAK